MFILAIFISILSSFLVISSFSTFYRDAYSNSITQMEIQRDIQMVGKLVLLSVTTEDTAEASKYVTVTAGKVQGIMDNVNALQNAFPDKNLAAQLAAEMEKLEGVITTLGEQVTAQDNEAALATLDTEFYAQSEAVSTVLDQIGTISDANATTELNISTYLAIGSIVFMIILSIVNVLYATRIAGTLTKLMVTPITNLKNAMAQMRQGNLDVSLACDTTDEFGELSHDFNVSCNTLHTIIVDAGELLAQMAEGNFNVNTQHEASMLPLVPISWQTVPRLLQRVLLTRQVP